MSAEREDKTQGALCLCSHRLHKKKEDNHPKFSGPEGQKVHEKRNPDEVLFSGRSTVLAAKLGERLSAHRKEVHSQRIAKQE